MSKTFKTLTISIFLLFILVGLVKSIPGEPVIPEVLVAPKIYASLGDSITQGANACEPHQECPEKSWATGVYEPESEDFFFNKQPATIREHLEALEDTQIEVYNNARSFTKVDDLPNQAQTTVTQKAEFITILSGANDICVPTVEEITSDENFRNSVKETLDILKTQLPQSKILVASIPNIHTLWKTNYTNDTAVVKWETSSLCGSMLKNPRSFDKEDTERRDQVLDRLKGFNKIWEEECKQYVNCLFDDNRVFNTVFSQNELSEVDFFHPSQAGHKLLAHKVWDENQLIQRFAYITKGKSSRSSEDAPIITVIQPHNKEIISGKDFRLKVKVESINPLERVYVDTQLGGVDLTYDSEEEVWFLQVDTTLAPNGLSTFFTVIAVDKEKEISITEKITVTVDNPPVDEQPMPVETINPSESPDISENEDSNVDLEAITRNTNSSDYDQ